MNGTEQKEINLIAESLTDFRAEQRDVNKEVSNALAALMQAMAKMEVQQAEINQLRNDAQEVNNRLNSHSAKIDSNKDRIAEISTDIAVSGMAAKEFRNLRNILLVGCFSILASAIWSNFGSKNDAENLSKELAKSLAEQVIKMQNDRHGQR